MEARDFSRVRLHNTSYFIAPREWVKDYDLSDVFATISLEGNIVRISPTEYDGEQYVDYDWQDFFVTKGELKTLKELAKPNRKK